MPEKRSYEIRLQLSYPPSEVKVNGRVFKYNKDKNLNAWNYNGSELVTNIFTSPVSVHKKVSIEVKFPQNDLSLISGKKKLFSNLMKVAKAIQLSGWNESESNSDSVIAAAQTGNRITLNPSSSIIELKLLDNKMPGLINDIQKQAGEESKLYKALELLKASIN